ncbi:MAG: hypothetical protein J7518_15795 [Nocardioidaceae bacterium]|nr:hypothetical protein [Nocardioidaceae bacterium]
MLYLEAPFHVIEGVAVFRDHADPQQWYAMPGAPRLVTVKETVAGQEVEVPQLSLIKFKGNAGTGGFLNFDVDLALPDELRDDVRTEIKRLEHLPDLPRLADLQVVDGTVRMMLFDKESPLPAPAGGGGGQPAPAPKPEEELLQFVLKLSHAAKPALYGSQRAAFSVQLTQEGVTTLEKAMAGELSPIGIIYSLDYLGLRPAYHVQVHVDWERVQKHIDEHEEFNVPLFYSSTVDKVLDELEDKRIIQITADTFVEEEDGSPVIARRDQAMDEVRDMITDAFFEPSLDPVDRGAGAAGAVQTFGRVLRAIGSGGMSEFNAFSRRKVDLTRIDKKRLDVSMSERTTVRRTIYPQGHLSGLFRVLRDAGLDMSRFVTEVDLDDPWFERRNVELVSRAEWVRDGIRSVDVDLDYRGKETSKLLDKDTVKETMSWSSVLENGGMVRDVEVGYTVNFADVDAGERPRSLTSKASIEKGDRIEIDPRELYSLVPVPVVALSFPWERYPDVEVEVAYDDPGNGIAQSDVVVLGKDKTDDTWSMFVVDPELDTFRYRITYRAADQRDVVGDWVSTDGERIIVRDPFPSGRILEVVPAVDWTEVLRVFVDVSYTDAEHGLHAEDSFEFTESQATTQTFAVALADPARRVVDYRVTVMKKNGETVVGPPSSTQERRVIVRADVAGHRVVTVRTDGGDFAAHKIRKMTVKLHYDDPVTKVDDERTLTSAADVAVFEFDFVAGGPDHFDYEVVTEFTNNLTKTRTGEGRESTLVVPVQG